MSEECRFRIYKSNKLEKFLPEVLKIIRRLSEDAPLKKKKIIIQSDGMARWLTLKAASEEGVFANFDFVSPDDFLKSFAEEYLGISRESVYDKKNAEWLLYSMLRNEKSGPAGKYIGGNEARAFRFSRTLADLFEQYFVYCPKMMKCWCEGRLKTDDPDESWQFDIFRKLAEKMETHGFAQLFGKKCLSAPKNADYQKDLILFGISIMNKYHLGMFRSLSTLFPVHIFSLSPSQAYFSVSKEKGDFKKQGEDLRFSTDSLPDTFFGRFCAAGLDFFNFVLDNPSEEKDLFEEPKDKTLLASLQRDILNDSYDPERSGDDESFRIIACRDKMREIEVLKDHLLELFNQDDSLKPEDVAVMAPKIDDYVPYITAVFEIDPNDKTFIPWVISDRTFSSESRIASTFLEMLELTKSNFEKSKVLSIFRSPCVCKKFGADEKTITEIEKLIDKSGIRWGLDADSRRESCEGCIQNTWDFGLSRIMMSFLMPFSYDGAGFENILPLDSFSKDDSENISGFITFAKELFLRLKQLSSSERTPAEFKDLLENMLDSFFAFDKSNGIAAKEILIVRNVIDDFAQAAGEVKLSFEALLQYLEDELGREHAGRGFLSAKVNFCSLKPLRALPFKVICLIGMGDGDFPRSENRYAFNLMQKKSMKELNAPMQRSVRDNDKYLFIEAIISAQQKLFVSYEAKDLSEDSKKHRSAALPVQILEKYIEKKTGVKADKLETKYPVQPFSDEYFKKGKFKTFSKKDFQFADAMFHVEQNTQSPAVTLVPEGKSDSCINEGNEVVDLEKLVSLFKNPSKFYFTKILKISLVDEGEEKGDEELFDYSSEHLLAYDLRQTYVEMARKMSEKFTKEPDEFNKDFVRRIKNEGKIPLGVFGEMALNELVLDSRLPYFAEKTAGKNLTFKDFFLDFEDLSLKLRGRIANIYREKSSMIQAFHSKNSPKYRIEAVIRHLAANAADLNLDTDFSINDKDSVMACILPNLQQNEAKADLFFFMKLWKSAKSSMPLFEPEIIESFRQEMFRTKAARNVGGKDITDEFVRKTVISFFEKKWLDRNSEYSFIYQEHLLAAEQFLQRKERFLSEFPSEEIQEICRLLEKFYPSR